MCIKRKCKYCGEIFNSTHIVRTVCDNPICKAKSRGQIRTIELFCKTCGAIIPLGCRRHKYCSDECFNIGKKKVKKIYQQTHKVTRCGCFMDCKAEVVYKSIGEVKV